MVKLKNMEKPFQKKKESGVNRVVGVDSELEKSLLNLFKGKFKSTERNLIEREHSPELDELIMEINSKMGEFLKEYGGNATEVPPRNIHLIDVSKLTLAQAQSLKEKFPKSSAFYLPFNQHIGSTLDESDKLRLAQALVHEMLHLNAFLSFQKTEGNDYVKKSTDEREVFSLKQRRVGFRIFLSNDVVYFKDIDEAIIQELTIRFDWKYFGYFSELEEDFVERQGALEAESRRTGESFEDLKRALAAVREEKRTDGHRFTARTPGYDEERERLYKLIDDLYQKNQTAFASKEEVFNLFAKATLTGRLLPIARLIEKTYGKGSFRKLGEETASSKPEISQGTDR